MAIRSGRTKRNLLRLHRWISLGFAALWLIQAVTGVLIVFHWEIDDATVAGEERPLDFVAVEARLDRLAPPGSDSRITSVWTSASAVPRLDIHVDGPVYRKLRVDGAGNVLRVRTETDGLANGGLIATLVEIHHGLLAGETGEWIIGISGVLFLTNILLGLVNAWPRWGSWRRSLAPARGPPPARFFAWHRAVGLWAAVPILFTVGAGTLLRFESGTAKLLGASVYEAPVETPADGARIGFAQAVHTALAEFPAARFSGAAFPSDEDATYRIRLLQPGEARRAWGTTNVFVSAVDGRVTARFDALAMPPARRFMDNLFPLHTGELGGTIGRMLVMALGLWLATMVVTGFLLWRARRRGRKA